MDEPLFDSKRAATIIRNHLMRELHDLQVKIMHAERFGPHSVIYPDIQTKPGLVRSVDEMKKRHDQYVDQINRLNEALEKADEIEIAHMVAAIKERHRRKP